MFLKLLPVLFLIVVSSATLRKNIEISPFIVNGTDAYIAEFPFIVSLQSIRNETVSFHSCGGSILNDYWILTAAHCIYGGNADNVLIEYGSSVIADGYNGPHISRAEKIIWHETYSSWSLQDDIGLIKLMEPIRLNLFNYKVKLPVKDEYFATGSPAVLAGWGRVGTGLPISTTLQKVDLQIFARFDCDQLHEPGNILYNNICAGVVGGGKGQCNGDSGGPLLVNGVQVGIVSWSMKPCTIAPYPGVFTAVSPYIDWIEENTGITFTLGMFLQGEN